MDFANAVTNKGLSLEPQKIFLTFFTPLLTTYFPTAGLSAIQVCTDFLLDWILSAEWSRLLTTYQVGKRGLLQLLPANNLTMTPE